MPIPFIAAGTACAVSMVVGWFGAKKMQESTAQKQDEIQHKINQDIKINRLERELAEKNRVVTGCGNHKNMILKTTNGSIEDQKSSIDLPKGTYKKIEESLSDLGDRVDKLSKREKLEILEQIKTASPEERKKIMEELKAQTNAEVEATNKVLKDQLDKLEKNNLKLADELRQAKENNNPQKMAQIMSMMKDNDKNQQATRLAIKKMVEHKEKQHKAIQEYVQHIDDPWYKDINWSSPLVWIIMLIAIGISIGTWFAFKWAWNKLKSTFTGS